jgi:hypothetical protein
MGKIGVWALVLVLISLSFVSAFGKEMQAATLACEQEIPCNRIDEDCDGRDICIDKDMRVFYTFDSNGVVIYDVSKHMDANMINVNFVTGKYGKAAYLNGVNSYFQSVSPNLLKNVFPSTGRWSFSIYIKPNRINSGISPVISQTESFDSRILNSSFRLSEESGRWILRVGKEEL